MDKLNKSIDWAKIKSILSCHYIHGTSCEGASAYHPILLYKCLLLQKWFRIQSDPELESQIKALLLMQDWLNQLLLPSAATRYKKNKENKHIRKTDKNGKPVKFSRDIESDWIVKNDKPHYGLKEHASVDVNHGFILAATLTPASVNDTNYLEYCTLYSRHTSREITKVYADKGYAGAPNRKFLSLNKIADGIMRKNSTTAKLTDFEKERNKKLSKKRYIVEQYFGLSHLNDNASRARFTTIAKNKFDIWMRQAAYNILKGVRILSKSSF